MLRLALIGMLEAMSFFLGKMPRHADSGDLGSLTRILENHNLTTFTSLLDKYPEILRGIEGFPQFTVIAPSNEAFRKASDLDMNNATMVTDLLRYHILQGRVAVADLELGDPVFVPTLLANTNASIDSTANQTAQSITIIRQSSDEVVLVTGGDSRSVVEDEDVRFHGGLIQVVSTLLVPPRALAPTARTWFTDLNAFLGALYATGLIDALDSSAAGGSRVTVFAPHNNAFQRVAGALDVLSPDELRDVLAYHIVPDEVLYSTHLRNASHWPTLAGGRNSTLGQPISIWLTAVGNSRYVDSSQIVDPDILIANGVMHMIADVLNPLRPDASPIPSLPVQSPVFELIGATATGHKALVPFTTALPCTADCPTTTDSPRTTTRAHRPAQSTSAGSVKHAGRGIAAVAAGLVGMGVVGVL